MPVAGVSRWTMLYFALSLVAFVLAQAMMAAGWSFPAFPIEAPETLIAVHLVTIGWLSTLILGALCQFLPVITAKPLPSDRLALASLVLLHSGLVILLAGFVALRGAGPVPVAVLPVGGAAVLMGFATGGANLALLLWHARPLPLAARFIGGGLAFLLVTGTLGLIFALVLASSALPDWLLPLFGAGLSLHLVAGIGGWFTLTAMGVSYRLLSMFMLAPEPESGRSLWVLRLSVSGLLIWWCAGLAEIYDVPRAAFLGKTGAALTLVALLLYAADMARLYRARKRRRLELNSATGAAAIGCLVIGTGALAGLTAVGRAASAAEPIAYLFLFGWLSGLGLGQLYKIVAFLTWLQRFGPMLGKAPVPRVQDLVNERRAAPWFFLYFAAVLAGTACGFLGCTSLWRAAVAAHLVATLGIIAELWRARFPRITPPVAEAGLYAKGET